MSTKIEAQELKEKDPKYSLGRKHVLDLDDFSSEELETIFSSADAMAEVMSRDIKKVPSLRGKIIMTLFYEPSTRTRVSFEQAGKVLSADVINLAASASSSTKGESLINTTRTLEAMGADVVVVRHPHSGAPYLMARYCDRLRIINAGDGRHAHPTQGLVDLYTVRQHLGDVSGKKVVIVGDITHSRVARSNLWGLLAMGARVTLSGPATMIPMDLLENSGTYSKNNNKGIGDIEIDTNLDRAIDSADIVMALRLQLERQELSLFPTIREYCKYWQVNEERLAKAKQNVLVMHPGPINEGIEITSAVAHGIHSRIKDQVKNGVAIRMALLQELLLPKTGDDL